MSLQEYKMRSLKDKIADEAKKAVKKVKKAKKKVAKKKK